jgi:4-amino-4-deoxy-L-arabinose transferase-like glycosyltransferase
MMARGMDLTVTGWAGGRSGAASVPRDAVVMGLFLVASALFLFLDAEVTPIILWDESRNVVNALEMQRNGWSLITTYDGQPDLWNTKPPLLIWLMSASVSLFGPSEWALRLPSALAALATLLMLLLFTRRVTGSLATACFAGGLLLMSPAFFGEHGARTADYDALLVFFTTAYLFALFWAVTRRRPGVALAAVAGLAIAGACLTKSVAGLVPGTGVAFYLVATGRLGRLVGSRDYLLLGAISAMPVLLFLVAREASSAGYVAAMLHNDAAARFSQSVVGRDNPWYFYLQEIATGWFVAGPLLLVAPLGWRAVWGKSRLLLIYCLCACAAPLLVLSLSATKLSHYMLPVFPLLAIAAALLLRGVLLTYFSAALRGRSRLLVLLLCALPLAPLAARAAHWRYVQFPERASDPQARYGSLLASLERRDMRQVIAVDGGFTLEGRPHYVPLVRAYQLMWQDRVTITAHLPAVEPGRAGTHISCDPEHVEALLRLGPDLAGVEGCAAVDLRFR